MISAEGKPSPPSVSPSTTSFPFPSPFSLPPSSNTSTHSEFEQEENTRPTNELHACFFLSSPEKMTVSSENNTQ